MSRSCYLRGVVQPRQPLLGRAIVFAALVGTGLTVWWAVCLMPTGPASATADHLGSDLSTGATRATSKPHVIHLSARDNKTTVTVKVGRRVDVSLSSTYWDFEPSTDATVLRQLGRQVTHPAPTGTCVPGQGCGTVSIAFTASHPGRASIVASRTSCGEAAGCSIAASHFRVTIVVRPSR